MSETDTAVAPPQTAGSSKGKAASKSSSTPRSDRRSRRKAGSQLPRGPRGGVQLLLIQSVEHLGKQGEVVEVKRGFALNYLLPQGLATIATDHHRRMVEKHRAKLDEIARQRMASLRAVLSELSRTSVTIEANANDEGHLYGSVGSTEISRSLKQQDLTVLPDQIILQGPLKEVGLYTVKVRLAPDAEGDLKVWVVPSSSEAGSSN
jgi:large subunit ribosomal protein L9